MRTFWVIGSCVCAVAAVVLTLRRNFDMAFAVAGFGAVAWFLSYRVQVRERVRQQELEDPDEEEEVKSDEEE